MEIQFQNHALLRAGERGATKEEIHSVLETGISIIAKYNRLGKEKTFQFEQIFNKRYYEQKKITVIFAAENDTFIVITVIVKYGKFPNNLS